MRPQLNRSSLVRLLQSWAQAGNPVPDDTIQALSGWLGAFEAITLNGVLDSIVSSAVHTERKHAPVDEAVLRSLVEATHAQLTGLMEPIQEQGPASRVVHRGRQTEPVRPLDPQALTEWAFHAHRHQSVQRQFDARLQHLRSQVRAQLAKGSTVLRQLATLDAVMAQMFEAQEKRLWATLLAQLERRFNYWSAQRSQPVTASEPDDVQRWSAPGGWLHSFEQDFRALLQAELQTRLQPVLGLVEAVQDSTRKTRS